MALSPISRFTAFLPPPPPFSLLIGVATLLCLGVGFRQANAAVYYVTTTGTGNGTSWAVAGPLQAVINTAVSGDQVWVKFGTYTGNFTAKDGVAVYGGFAGTETMLSQRNVTANPTILDGNNSGTVYTIPSSATGTNTLDGFIVQQGSASRNGGGLDDPSRDSLHIANCAFSGNSAGGNGGGIYGGSLYVTGCTFMSNSANRAGGMETYDGTSVITNCTFTNNTSGTYGGGLEAEGSVLSVTGCTFTGNSTSSGGGGGINAGGSNDRSGVFTFTGCTFTANVAGGPASGGNGGALNLADAFPIIVQSCMFTGNIPSAVLMVSTGTSSVPSTLKDCKIFGNGTSAGDPVGIDLIAGTTYLTVANNTIVNTNVGLNDAAAGGAVSVANNIFYGNNGGLNYTGSAAFTSSHNDLFASVSYYYQGVPLSFTDTTVNPMFVRNPNFSAVPPDDGDLHLKATSPLINAGDDTYVSSGDTDLDGHPRVQGSHVDVGAYEATGPAPTTVTSLNPAAIQAGHYNFPLIVIGTAFLPGAVVLWNGNALPTTYVSATEVSAVVPTSYLKTVGTASVTEVNPGAVASNALTFTITPGATLTSLSPASAVPGSPMFTLTVTGTNFVNKAVVYWNGAALTSTFVSATELTAIVPASDVAALGTAQVTAANPNTSPTNALVFAIENPSSTLTSLSPSSATAGSGAVVVVITGTGFVSGSVADWNGAALTSAYFSPTTIVAYVPASDLATAGTDRVTVVNPGAAPSNALTFTVNAPPKPAHLTSLSPSSVTRGSAAFTLTVNGTGFVPASVIKLEQLGIGHGVPRADGRGRLRSGIGRGVCGNGERDGSQSGRAGVQRADVHDLLAHPNPPAPLVPRFGREKKRCRTPSQPPPSARGRNRNPPRLPKRPSPPVPLPPSLVPRWGEGRKPP